MTLDFLIGRGSTFERKPLMVCVNSKANELPSFEETVQDNLTLTRSNWLQISLPISLKVASGALESASTRTALKRSSLVRPY